MGVNADGGVDRFVPAGDVDGFPALREGRPDGDDVPDTGLLRPADDGRGLVCDMVLVAPRG